MKQLSTALCVALFALFMTGCSTPAPQYSASLDNVAALKQGGDAKAKVGTFMTVKAKGNANPISLRGTAMTSPYQGSYANYVTEALKQELTTAGKYAADASTEITGTLLKNDLDASGINTGDGNIEVRFVVKNSDGVKFDKVKSVKHQWESSFAGYTAIPRAMEQYPILVRKLLAELYADPDFAASIK